MKLERLCYVRVSRPHVICLFEDSFIIGYYHHIRRYKRDSGKYVQSFKGHTSLIHSLFVWKDFLFSGDHDGKLLQWHVPTGHLLGRFQREIPSTIIGFQVRGDTLLYTVHDIGVILVWDLRTKHVVSSQRLPLSISFSLPWGGDSLYVIKDDQVALSPWYVSTQAFVPPRLLTIEVHNSMIWGANSSTLWQWDLETHQEVGTYDLYNIVGLCKRHLFRYEGNKLYVYKVWDYRLLAACIPSFYPVLCELVLSYLL